MALHITINGEPRELDLAPQSTVHDLLALLALKADQVAVERNGAIVRRAEWPGSAVQNGDRFEIVQFVGGGSCPVSSERSRSHRLP